MVGIYLSGTGNTRHCIKKLVSLLDENAECLPLEDKKSLQAIKQNEIIIYGYPVQFSNAPIFARDFIKNSSEIWKGKKVLCVATMGFLSGDGAGCTARLFKKYGATVLGGLHLHMPDSVCDSKALQKSTEENHSLILKADEKIEKTAENIKISKYPHQGMNVFSILLGLLSQRIWWHYRTSKYSDSLKISDECIGCGLCVNNCPLGNLKIVDGIAKSSNHCTMCYRCINSCPKKAITLLGSEVIEQYRFENYQ